MAWWQDDEGRRDAICALTLGKEEEEEEPSKIHCGPASFVRRRRRRSTFIFPSSSSRSGSARSLTLGRGKRDGGGETFESANDDGWSLTWRRFLRPPLERRLEDGGSLLLFFFVPLVSSCCWKGWGWGLRKKVIMKTLTSPRRKRGREWGRVVGREGICPRKQMLQGFLFPFSLLASYPCSFSLFALFVGYNFILRSNDFCTKPRICYCT